MRGVVKVGHSVVFAFEDVLKQIGFDNSVLNGVYFHGEQVFGGLSCAEGGAGVAEVVLWQYNRLSRSPSLQTEGDGTYLQTSTGLLHCWMIWGDTIAFLTRPRCTCPAKSGKRRAMDKRVPFGASGD